MNSGAEPGHVYLVGAGPGDPNLLTLRAADLLRTADVLLPDDLVSEEVLALASPTALIVPVGKRCGQPRVTQAGIHELMLHHAGQGASVLRLKSGDPLVFGRAAEEMAALRAAHVPFEVVPGISAAFAVAAALQVPLTDRSYASRLIFATAHHAAGKLGLPLNINDAAPNSMANATLAIYMPGRDFATLAATLLASGVPAEMPVIAVSQASTPQQRINSTTVGDLPQLDAGIAPVVVLVGHSLRR